MHIERSSIPYSALRRAKKRLRGAETRTHARARRRSGIRNPETQDANGEGRGHRQSGGGRSWAGGGRRRAGVRSPETREATGEGGGHRQAGGGRGGAGGGGGGRTTRAQASQERRERVWPSAESAGAARRLRIAPAATGAALHQAA